MIYSIKQQYGDVYDFGVLFWNIPGLVHVYLKCAHKTVKPLAHDNFRFLKIAIYDFPEPSGRAYTFAMTSYLAWPRPRDGSPQMTLLYRTMIPLSPPTYIDVPSFRAWVLTTLERFIDTDSTDLNIAIIWSGPNMLCIECEFHTFWHKTLSCVKKLRMSIWYIS